MDRIGDGGSRFRRLVFHWGTELMLCRIVLVCLAALALTACNKSWSPSDGTRVYKSSYELTRDGYYRVRRGDTLHAIAFNFGLDWRDLARWNSISAPYTIYPDQELRVSPPSRPKVTTAPAKTPAPVKDRPAATSSSRSSDSVKTTASTEPPKPAATQQRTSMPDPGRWLWPTEGRIVSSFRADDPARNGIEIAGREGQPILATAAGEVVYSGGGLLGYGELIIIKHSDRMLSAYGHNRKRLVTEGQAVAAGERIAEMGKDERNKALLHFEIRRDGNPQNPEKYLPNR
jgi:lipoprotein NlpD